MVGSKPVLQLVHDYDDAFMSVFIIDKLLPVHKLFILICKLCIAQALCLWICIKEINGILHHSGGLAVSLPSGKDDKPLRAEKVRLPFVNVIDITPRGIPKETHKQ